MLYMFLSRYLCVDCSRKRLSMASCATRRQNQIEHLESSTEIFLALKTQPFHLDVEILLRLYDKVDVSKLRSSVDWETFLQEGLSFVVDTNEEYNVKGLMEKEPVEETNKVGRLLTFEQIQNVNSFTIMLDTISK